MIVSTTDMMAAAASGSLSLASDMKAISPSLVLANPLAVAIRTFPSSVSATSGAIFGWALTLAASTLRISAIGLVQSTHTLAASYIISVKATGLSSISSLMALTALVYFSALVVVSSDSTASSSTICNN